MTHALRSFACLLLAAGWAGGAAAQEAGRVILSIGEVTIQRGAAVTPAPVGAVLNNGDTLRVGASSNAQVRFVDEAIIALRPGTEFKVDDYNWPGAANGLERAFFSLLKGGLRTVTGAIGKANQQNYKVTTPTAALGIRGTNFNLVHCDAECANKDGTAARGGTYGGVFDGKIGVGNQAGERVFGADEFFHVASLTSPAERLIGPPPFLGDRLAGASRRKGEKGAERNESTQSGVDADSRPLASPAPTPPPPFVATEQRIEGGGLAAVNTYTHAVTVGNTSFSNEGESENFAVSAADLVFSGTGAAQTLVSITIRPNAALQQEAGQGTVGPGGTDMVGYGAAVNAHWGRWVDGKVTDDQAPGGFFVPPGGVHYLYSDQITSAELIAAKSGSFSYNVVVGGTNPTDNLGNIGSFTSGSMNVNFTNRTTALSAAWNVAGSNYAIVSLPGTISITPGVGAGTDNNGNGVGTCAGPCGGAPGTIQKVKASGVFIGATGNHLPVSIGTTNGTQSTSQVQLFYCPTCP